MRIAVKASHITHGGGLTHFNHTLKWFSRLKPDWEFMLIAKDGQEELFWNYGQNVNIVFYNKPSQGLIAEMLWERNQLPNIIDEYQPNLYFVPGNHTGQKAEYPTVSLVHNIAPFSKKFIAKESMYQKFRLNLLRYLTIKSLNNSDGIVFLSDYCRKYFGQFYDTKSNRSITAYHGRPEDTDDREDTKILKKYNIESEFILSVSHIYEYKKIKEMVDGYLLALSQNLNLPQLLIAGQPYDKAYKSAIEKRINSSDFRDKIRFLGNVNEHELQALYRNCHMFIFPSSLETCSVILIEAMSAAAPVICSNKTVMPEVTGHSAIYYHPENSRKLAESILRLHNDKHIAADQKEKMKSISLNYSWKKSSGEILTFFEELVKNKTSSKDNESLVGV